VTCVSGCPDLNRGLLRPEQSPGDFRRYRSDAEATEMST
jgi:hypothetical protein